MNLSTLTSAVNDAHEAEARGESREAVEILSEVASRDVATKVVYGDYDLHVNAYLGVLEAHYHTYGSH